MKKQVILFSIIAVSLLFLRLAPNNMNSDGMKETSVCISHCLVNNQGADFKVTPSQGFDLLILVAATALLSVLIFKEFTFTFASFIEPPPKLFKLYSQYLN